MSDILYRYGSTYYINMTNRCPCKCVFCVRNSTDSLGDAECLWLDREPTPEEVLEEISRVDLSKSREIVFCGYGEPTERFDDMLEVARGIKARYSIDIRLDTNGLGCLINKRDIVPDMVGLIDAVSISLNASDPDEYLEVTRSEFGEGSYEAVLDFIRACRESLRGVTVSVVGGSISSESEEKCARIADSLNVAFRVR
jgi:TatD family-associated radical SAM protein